MNARGERRDGATTEIKLDGRDLKVPEASTILDACRLAGIEVPTLCFLEGMTPANACRICVI